MSGGPRKRRADEALIETPPSRVQRFARVHLGRVRNRRRHGRRRHDTAHRNRHGERREHVLQLSHVPGPIIPRQRRQRGLPEHRFAADALHRVAPEPPCEQRNIFHPLTERRHCDTNHVKAIQQVLPEPAGLNFGRQRAIRGGNQSGIDRPGEVLADAADFAFLQCPQKFGLSSGR